MGGLTVAALLARKGRKILLLEKEGQVGGYVVSFKRGGYTFDATGTFLGGCQEGGEFYNILREVGAHEAIEFIPIHHIRNIYSIFAFYDAGLPHLATRPGMFLYEIDAFHQQCVIFRVGKADLAFLAFVLAGDNQHVIILLNLHL